MGPVLHDMVRRGRSFSGHERNCSFLNLGDGRFADISANSGFDFPDDGRALASCDWDGDGDLDFWVANRNAPQVRLLQNRLATTNHYVTLRLVGTNCNRDAIGARVEVSLPGSDTTPLIQTLRAGEGFLAQSSKSLHFGLGAADRVADIVVHWPGGDRESFGQLEVDGRYKLVQGKGRAESLPPRKQPDELAPSDFVAEPTTNNLSVVSSSQLPVPLLDYETFDGKRRLLGERKPNGPLLINFWASWCRACMGELKEFAVHADQLESAGLDVVALSVDRLDVQNAEKSANVAALLDDIGFDGTAGWATESTIETLRMMREHLFDFHQPLSLPTSILIDSQNRLAAIYQGPVAVEQLLADVADLDTSLASKSQPFAGRWHTTPGRISPFDLVWQLVEADHLDQAIRYVETHRRLIENHFNAPKLLTLIGNGELARGAAERAMASYRQALQLDVSYSEAQNNLAWVLATDPDVGLRNGAEALDLAKAAIRQGRGDIVSMLDTLAAAYAEKQDFERAAEAARKAIELADASGRMEQSARIQQRLKMYEANRPFRAQ